QTGKPARGIAVDERSSFALEPSGEGTVIGNTPVYFIETDAAPDVCQKGTPLTMRGVKVKKVLPGAHFNVKNWSGEISAEYTLDVIAGAVQSSQPGGSLY
ncbi:MAG: hypothetical protein JOZ43_01125, partial [Acidobacteriales bacterium]|nr:hypothetical protein [Terriglobales bacterium]